MCLLDSPLSITSLLVAPLTIQKCRMQSTGVFGLRVERGLGGTGSRCIFHVCIEMYMCRIYPLRANSMYTLNLSAQNERMCPAPSRERGSNGGG